MTAGRIIPALASHLDMGFSTDLQEHIGIAGFHIFHAYVHIHIYIHMHRAYGRGAKGT